MGRGSVRRAERQVFDTVRSNKDSAQFRFLGQLPEFHPHELFGKIQQKDKERPARSGRRRGKKSTLSDAGHKFAHFPPIFQIRRWMLCSLSNRDDGLSERLKIGPVCPDCE